MRHDDPDRTKAVAVDPLVGMVIDRRYRVEFRLAAGGFGAIYRARHVINNRAVALKILHENLATEPDVVARFRREGAALAQLRSPHTISAFDFGQTRDGTLYIAMELLQGESLYERYSALGPLPWQRLVAIARQVCSSLAEAHALGTFDYMAPEQMVGGETTGQSDIFTLGIVMYEMLAGERPFGDPATPAAMLTAILAMTPVPVSTYAVDIPSELDAIVARCLDREPSKRYRDVVELADDLDALRLVDERAKTKISRVRMTTDPTSLLGLAEDSLTWIDKAPEPPESPIVTAKDAPAITTLPGVKPPAPVEPASPLTTLPGVAPPSRNTPWPISDPARKKR